jgi:hypothetical protein
VESIDVSGSVTAAAAFNVVEAVSVQPLRIKAELSSINNVNFIVLLVPSLRGELINDLLSALLLNHCSVFIVRLYIRKVSAMFLNVKISL